MRPRPILLLSVPAVIVAGHTALWVWATGQLRTGLDAWAADRRAEGWTVSHAPPSRGGWPLAASLTVPDPAVSSSAGLSWQGEQVVLRVGLARPAVLTVAPEGVHALRFGASPPVEVSAGSFSLDVPLAAPGPAELLARDLRVSAEGETAAAGLLTGRVSADGRDARFTLSAEAVSLPEDVRWVLGPHVSSATAEGSVSGLGASGPRAWRDAGGMLDVARFALGWGPLGASGTGRLGLDARLQPEAGASVRLVGAGAALDAAAAGGMIEPSVAATAKAVLALLQGAQDSGGRIEVPLSLKDGTVAAAGVPLARVPRMAWPPP